MKFSEAFNPIRAIQSTFEVMKLKPAHLWGGAILLIFVEGMAGVGFQFTGPVIETGNENLIVGVLCISCVLMLGVMIAGVWLTASLYLNMGSVMKTGEPSEGGLFDHEGKFVPLLMTRLLVFAIVFVGVICIYLILGFVLFWVFQAVPTGINEPTPDFSGVTLAVLIGAACLSFVVWVALIYVSLGVQLAECAVVFEELTPTEGIKRSWALVSGNRWRLLLFQIVNGIFVLLGLFLCCVGVYATGAVARLALVEAYLQLTGDEERPESLGFAD